MRFLSVWLSVPGALIIIFWYGTPFKIYPQWAVRIFGYSTRSVDYVTNEFMVWFPNHRQSRQTTLFDTPRPYVRQSIVISTNNKVSVWRALPMETFYIKSTWSWPIVSISRHKHPPVLDKCFVQMFLYTIIFVQFYYLYDVCLQVDRSAGNSKTRADECGKLNMRIFVSLRAHTR